MHDRKKLFGRSQPRVRGVFCGIKRSKDSIQIILGSDHKFTGKNSDHIVHRIKKCIVGRPANL